MKTPRPCPLIVATVVPTPAATSALGPVARGYRKPPPLGWRRWPCARLRGQQRPGSPRAHRSRGHKLITRHSRGASPSSLRALTPGHVRPPCPSPSPGGGSGSVTGGSPRAGKFECGGPGEGHRGGSELLRAAAFPHVLICVFSLKGAKNDTAASPECTYARGHEGAFRV